MKNRMVLIVPTIAFCAGISACYPAQRPYAFTLPTGAATDASDLLRAMRASGLTPADNQCEAGVLYTKWEDTGRRDGPLSYDGDIDTEVFRRFAVHLDRGAKGSTLHVQLETQRCEIPAVVIVGTSYGDRGKCVPDDVPGTGQCMGSDASRPDPADQTQLDQHARQLQLVLASGEHQVTSAVSTEASTAPSASVQ